MKQTKKTHFEKIKFKQVWRCFIPDRDNKYQYLGITWNPYSKGTIEYSTIEQFIVDVDKFARPKYFPKFILRLLHLFGNDNSIVRLRNRRFSEWSRKILKGIMITDIKTKWDEYDIRIYGYFPYELDKKIEDIETLFEQLSTEKYGTETCIY